MTTEQAWWLLGFYGIPLLCGGMGGVVAHWLLHRRGQ